MHESAAAAFGVNNEELKVLLKLRQTRGKQLSPGALDDLLLLRAAR